MKKIIAILLVLVMLLSFGACGNKKEEPKTEVKTLKIGTSPDFPPFEYLDGQNVVGIEIDILDAAAEKLGMKLEIVQMDFDSVLPGVQAGKLDIGASGITITESRQKEALFTQPYCLAAQAIVVVEGSPITCKADLSGKKVAVQTATTAEEFCMAEGYDVFAYQANNDAESAVVTGKVDAWVIDDLTASAMVEEYNKKADKKLVILSEAMTTEPYGFAAKKGNEELIGSMDEIISAMLKDGSIKKIFDKYGAPYTSPVK